VKEEFINSLKSCVESHFAVTKDEETAPPSVSLSEEPDTDKIRVTINSIKNLAATNEERYNRMVVEQIKLDLLPLCSQSKQQSLTEEVLVHFEWNGRGFSKDLFVEKVRKEFLEKLEVWFFNLVSMVVKTQGKPFRRHHRLTKKSQSSVEGI